MPLFKAIVGNPPWNEINQKSMMSEFTIKAIFIKPRYCLFILASHFRQDKKLYKARKVLCDRDHVHTIKLFNRQQTLDIFSIEPYSGSMYFMWNSSYSGQCIINGIAQSINPEYIVDDKVFNKIRKVKTNSLTSKAGFECYPNKYTYDTNNSILYNYTLNSEKLKMNKKYDINSDVLHKWKVCSYLISNFGKRIIFRTIPPNESMTHHWYIIRSFNSKDETMQFERYLNCPFVQFILRISMASFMVTHWFIKTIPDIEYITDEELYKMFNLTQEEIDHIEGTVACLK